MYLGQIPTMLNAIPSIRTQSPRGLRSAYGDRVHNGGDCVQHTGIGFITAGIAFSIRGSGS